MHVSAIQTDYLRFVCKTKMTHKVSKAYGVQRLRQQLRNSHKTSAKEEFSKVSVYATKDYVPEYECLPKVPI